MKAEKVWDSRFSYQSFLTPAVVCSKIHTIFQVCTARPYAKVWDTILFLHRTLLTQTYETEQSQKGRENNCLLATGRGRIHLIQL